DEHRAGWRRGARGALSVRSNRLTTALSVFAAISALVPKWLKGVSPRKPAAAPICAISPSLHLRFRRLPQQHHPPPKIRHFPTADGPAHPTIVGVTVLTSEDPPLPRI